MYDVCTWWLRPESSPKTAPLLAELVRGIFPKHLLECFLFSRIDLILVPLYRKGVHAICQSGVSY